METINVSKMILELKIIKAEIENRIQHNSISFTSLDRELRDNRPIKVVEVFPLIMLRSQYSKYHNGLDADAYFLHNKKIELDDSGLKFNSKYYKSVFYDVIAQSFCRVPHYSLGIFLDDINNQDGFLFTHDKDSSIIIRCYNKNDGTSVELKAKRLGYTFTLYKSVTSFYTIATHILSNDTIDKLYYKPKTQG